jgi:tRNA A22 N-methylase
MKIFFEVFEVAGMGGSLILEYLEERKLVILQKFKEQPKTGFGPFIEWL